MSKKGDFNMSIIKEFKEFAFKGNVLDMAVGVVIGSSFGKIVTSICSLLLNDIKFTDLKIGLKGDSAIMIGNFIQTFVDFIIIAASVFVFVKIINGFKRKKEVEVIEEAPKAPTTEELLTEIRDLMKGM